jgi:hypothetical protein
MTYFQAKGPTVKFMTRIAFNCAVFLTLSTLAPSASADQFFYVDKEGNKVVDEEGNVHFQKPLNQVRSSAFNSQNEQAILRLEAEFLAAIDDSVDDNNQITERLDDLANLWTENGTYISDLVSVVAGFRPDLKALVEDGNKVQGRENLKKLIGILGESGSNGKRHLVSNVRVEFITQDLAIGQSEFVIAEATIVPPAVNATGRYNSVYQKVEGKWLFRQRKHDIDPAHVTTSDPPQFITIHDIVFDLKKRIEQLEAQINPE